MIRIKSEQLPGKLRGVGRKASRATRRRHSSSGAGARAQASASPQLTLRKGPAGAGLDQAAAAVDFGPMPNLIGYYLRRLQVAYKKHFMRVASELNILPNDVNAIVVIGLNPGLTPARLSMVLELDAAKITYILKMFEIRGLLVRKISEADGRSRTICLTNAGRKFLNRLLKLAKMADSTFMDGRLTAAETEQFVQLMAKLLGARQAEDAQRLPTAHS